MDDEVYSFALKNTLDEVKNVCSDITSTFMFREDGEIIAGDKDTLEKTMVNGIDAFDGVLERAEAIGGVEGITIEGNNGRVNVSRVNDLYLVTVTSKKADIKYVNTVTRVLIPTILKLLEKINPAPLKTTSPLKRKPEIPIEKEIEEPSTELPEERTMEEKEEKVESKMEHEQSLPEPPVNQLIVENLGGLLVPSDTIRIDSKVLLEWEELYEGRKIEEVEIATFDGKTTKCKVKPIKDSKYEGKGIMQVPEKIQSALEIRKGELVRAKPLIE